MGLSTKGMHPGHTSPLFITEVRGCWVGEMGKTPLGNYQPNGVFMNVEELRKSFMKLPTFPKFPIFLFLIYSFSPNDGPRVVTLPGGSVTKIGKTPE